MKHSKKKAKRGANEQSDPEDEDFQDSSSLESSSSRSESDNDDGVIGEQAIPNSEVCILLQVWRKVY